MSTRGDDLIRVCSTAHEGRFNVAATDIGAGTTLYQSTAYAAALYDEFVPHVCARCFAISAAVPLVHKCEACRHVFYCSSECKWQHAEHSAPGVVPHVTLCPAFQRLKPLEEMGTLFKARLILEILARRRAVAQKGAASAHDEFDQLVYHEPLSGWVHDEQSERWCDALREALASCDWWNAVPAAEVTSQALLTLICKVDANGFDCKTHATGGESIGVAVYLGGSQLFNHSCMPNCREAHAMPILSVTSTRGVASGEPLTFSYIDPRADLATRRELLWLHYGFECACERCAAEAAAAEEEDEASALSEPCAQEHLLDRGTTALSVSPLATCLLRWHLCWYVTAIALAGAGFWPAAAIVLVGAHCLHCVLRRRGACPCVGRRGGTNDK
jgi:hypothetical protein